MENIYHLVYPVPRLERWGMPVGLEDLAQQIVKSGLLRLDLDYTQNFVRYKNPAAGAELMISRQQLYDPVCLKEVRQDIGRVLLGKRTSLSALAANEKAVDKVIVQLRGLLDKKIPFDPVIEEKVARMIAQVIPPVVVALVLLERTQIYVSFSHSVGDMMDAQSWQEVGSSSGLQSTWASSVGGMAVYVSCGGNPFAQLKKEEISLYSDMEYGDGFPALARFMVIGGQEFGHYSDVIRDRHGRVIGRHSASRGGRRASPKAKKARLADIKACNALSEYLKKIGLRGLYRLENAQRFYGRTKRYRMKRFFLWIWTRMVRQVFIWRCRRAGYEWINEFPLRRYLAYRIYFGLQDMLMNLAPQADAYKRDDVLEEEAIACIEALARVPQQVNKYGHGFTKACMHELYHLYYDEVIPACYQAYGHYTGKEFSCDMTPIAMPLSVKLKRLYRYLRGKTEQMPKL